MSRTLGKLRQKNHGQAITEYAVILAVIVIVVAGSLGLFVAWVKSQ